MLGRIFVLLLLAAALLVVFVARRLEQRARRRRSSSLESDSDALHASATINADSLLSVQVLNTTKEAIPYQLQIAGHHAEVTIPANAVQTVRVRLQD